MNELEPPRNKQIEHIETKAAASAQTFSMKDAAAKGRAAQGQRL